MKAKTAVPYVFMCSIWGSTWLAIKIGLDAGLSPILFCGVRFLVAVIFLGAVLRLQKFPMKMEKGEFSISLFMGVFMIAVPYALVFWGEQYTDSAMGAIIMCTMPLLCFPVSYLMKSGERFGAVKFIGVLLGMAGVALIFYPKLAGGAFHVKGDAAIFLSVAIYAVSTVYFKKYATRIPIRRCVFYQMLFAVPILLTAGITLESPHDFMLALHNWRAVSALLYLAIFGSVITFIIYYWLVIRIGAIASASAIFLEVGLAIFLDWMVMAVVPHSWTWAGIALISAGVWFVMVMGRGAADAGPVKECPGG